MSVRVNTSGRWRGRFVVCMGDKPKPSMVLMSGGEWIRFHNRQDAEAYQLDWLTASCAIQTDVTASVWHEDELDG